MKYTKEEAFEEILKRSKALKLKRAKKVTRALVTSAGILTASLVLEIRRFCETATAINKESIYGSFLLPVQAGGYVLTAVIAFVVGMIAAVLIQKFRKNNDEPQK